MKDLRQHYINGDWVDSAEPHDYEVLNPATEEAIAIITLGNTTDVNRAVTAASSAQADWAATPIKTRIEYVRAILKAYVPRAEEMAQAISQEMGAPIDFARELQADALPFHTEGFLQAVEAFTFEHTLKGGVESDYILHEPIGVVGLITPWNWPINQIALKAVPAMLAGCASILKPSEEAPLSARLFAELVHEAGLPAGVFNLVNGDGKGVGKALTEHPGIQMVSFTGSARAGREISRAAAETLKTVTLELGGKGANIICPDADDDAIRRGVLHCMENTGQSCNAPTRMLLPAKAYDTLSKEAAAIAEEIEVGDPQASGKHIGPLINRAQWDKVQDYIQIGLDEGARLVAGGLGLPDGVNRGYYARPTVFADVTKDMRIAREEIFGPVLCLIPYQDEADAIRIANDSPYGLTHFVQSQSVETLQRIARQLQAGMVDMNGVERGQLAPFGGVKQSGRAREGGVFGLEEFLLTKAVAGWMG